MSEWKKFHVGIPTKNGFNENCREFDSVSHTTHVDTAIAIISAGEIRPMLVFDDSKLNGKRILVSCLLPNE